jgi:hypothetical protein
MNSSNTDPLPEQGPFVAPFLSPAAFHLAPSAPSFPLQKADDLLFPDDIPLASEAPRKELESGASSSLAQSSIGDEHPDPDWSVAPLPKLPPFIERLPDSITLRKVATDFGLDSATFNGTRYRCPFHDDKRPSLKLNQPDSKAGWFYCFGCGASGDLIKWVANHTKQSNLNAFMLIRQSYGLGPDDILHAAKPRAIRGKVRIGGRRAPTLAELEALASSGSWDLSALRILACRDLLQVVPRYGGHRAYALIDPYYRVAVLRRMDGLLWNGTEKALLAKGSIAGVPIGVHHIEAFDLVALCEGGPDYFRLLSLITDAGSSDSILPLMMPSAIATKIHPSVLASFRLKRVRIFAHNDQRGIASAKSWKEQLQKVRAQVDLWIPPLIPLPDGQPTTDLQDLYFKLSPNSRASLTQLADLLNFNVILFPEPLHH